MFKKVTKCERFCKNVKISQPKEISCHQYQMNSYKRYRAKSDRCYWTKTVRNFGNINHTISYTRSQEISYKF